MTATPEVQQHMEMLRCRSLDKLCEEERLRRLSERMRRDPADSAEPARELRAQQTSTVARQALVNSSEDDVLGGEQNPGGDVKIAAGKQGKLMATRRVNAVQALEDQLEQRRHTTLLEQIGSAGERNNCPSLIAPTLGKRVQPAPQAQQQPLHAPRGRRGPNSPVGRARGVASSPLSCRSARPSVSTGSALLHGVGSSTPLISPTSRTRSMLGSSPRSGTTAAGTPQHPRGVHASTPALAASTSMSVPAPLLSPTTPTMSSRPRRSTGGNSPCLGPSPRSGAIEALREKLEEVKKDVQKVRGLERSARWDTQREERRHTETTRNTENRSLMEWRSQQALGLRAESDRVKREARTREQADSRLYQTFVRVNRQARKEQEMERNALELCEHLDQATHNLEVQRASFLKAQALLEERAQSVFDLRDIRDDQVAEEKEKIVQDREHELELNMALKVKDIFSERSRLEKSLNHMNARRQANPLKVATARKSISTPK